MKYIRNKKFEKLEAVSSKKSGIRFLNKDTLIKKIDESDLSTVKELKQKRVEKVILPDKIYKVLFTNTLHDVYAYTEEFQKDTYTLTAFDFLESSFSDKEILKFYRDLLEGAENMHKAGIYSGDMWSNNILMNDCLDYRFVDLEKGLTDLNPEPKVFEEALFLRYYDFKILNAQYSAYEQMELSDKLSLWNSILYCMKNGNFPEVREYIPTLTFDVFEFPCGIDKKLLEFISLCNITPKDHLIDIMDTLIKKDYKLPYRKNR